MTKEASFFRNLSNKLEGMGIATQPVEFNRIMSALKEQDEKFQKLEEELSVVQKKLQESLKQIGAKFDHTDDSFVFEGKKYFISIRQA